jgi:hypothetical protein
MPGTDGPVAAARLTGWRSRRRFTERRRYLEVIAFLDLLHAAVPAGQVIRAFIDTYNRLHARPFKWTYTGDPLAA